MNPRTRLIHPGISKNETLADLGPECQFTFAVLPCYVDKEGRVEDRPRRLQAEILPYSKTKMTTVLQKLATAGFIQRYQVGAESFLQIVNWKAYQTPHHKEHKSVIPTPEPLSQAQPNVNPTSIQEQAVVAPSSYIETDIDIEVETEIETGGRTSQAQAKLKPIQRFNKWIEENQAGDLTDMIRSARGITGEGLLSEQEWKWGKYQIDKMRTWITGNPDKCKNRNQWGRFVASWLNREVKNMTEQDEETFKTTEQRGPSEPTKIGGLK